MKLFENPELVEVAEEVIWGVIGTRELLKDLPAEPEQAYLEAVITAAAKDILEQVEALHLNQPTCN